MKEKGGHPLYRSFCPNNFFLTFVLSQCIVYRIHFQNKDTFTYQETLLHTPFCLFSKLWKAFRVHLIYFNSPQFGIQ